MQYNSTVHTAFLRRCVFFFVFLGGFCFIFISVLGYYTSNPRAFVHQFFDMHAASRQPLATSWQLFLCRIIYGDNAISDYTMFRLFVCISLTADGPRGARLQTSPTATLQSYPSVVTKDTVAVYFLYGEYLYVFSFPMVFFYLVTTGWILTSAYHVYLVLITWYVRVQQIDSINQINQNTCRAIPPCQR